MPARSAPELRFYAATPSRWPDVESLFGERGACGGCWCMYWRLSRKEFEAGKGTNGTGNRGAFHELIRSGARPGVIAYLGREPVGWCAVAPRSTYGSLARSRVLKPIDDKPVWSISCLFVAKAHRRHGISTRLIEAAVDFAARRGARIVEGYPLEPKMAKTPDAFVWLGLPSSFRRAGFKEVARRSPTRPIMRRHIRARRGGRGAVGHSRLR